MEFKMPDIGEGVAEGEIVKWLIKEGDSVVDDQPMVEVMTDKATVVIPCPTKGQVQKILVAEGKSAAVGSVLVVIGDGSAAPAPAPAAPAAQAPAVAPAAPAVAPAVAAPAPPVQATVAAPATPAAPVVHPSGRVLAAPATRRMAREQGVDLAYVQGSGPNGRVTRGDLEAFLANGQSTAYVAAPPSTWPGEMAPAPEVAAPAAAPRVAPAAAPTAPPPPPRPSFPPGPRPEQRVPMRGMRKRISENMRRSKDHAAHFTYVEECDMTELVSLRDAADSLARDKGVRLTYLPFIVKAVVAALKEFPYLNSSYDEEKQEIVLKGYYNLGIAASNDEGLVVPVVKDCDRKSILDIGAEIGYLGQAAKTNTLKLEDLQGSTFTISSLGALGGILATPVIYYPEVAIMGVHKIRKRPVVRNNEIVIRDICYLSISIDHRIVDGHIGAQFMQRVVQLLEDPRLLMLGA